MSKFTRPTAERLRHANGSASHVVLDDTDAAGRKISVVTTRIAEDTLDRLLHRKPPAITGDQYHAGMRLYADWYYGFGGSTTTLNLARDIVDGGQYDPDTERRMAAKQRHHLAVKSLWDKHRLVLQCCVLQDESLESFGCRIRQVRNKKRGREAALDLLRDALDELSAHYNGRRSGGGTIRSAHDADYRPAGLASDWRPEHVETQPEARHDCRFAAASL
jgi:hypothetical protein